MVHTDLTPIYCTGRSRQAWLPSPIVYPLSVTLWSKVGVGWFPGWRKGTIAVPKAAQTRRVVALHLTP